MKTALVTAAAALATVLVAAGPAAAGKETFQRTKPHVAAGSASGATTGSSQQHLQFEIQVMTSRMQNAEIVRPQSRQSPRKLGR